MRGFVFVLGLLELAVVILAVALSMQPEVPMCQEDQVLIGIGNFDHGRWEAYMCGPAVDDFAVLP